MFLILCFSVFIRGSSAISTDSGASAFWDKYLEFELTQFASAPVQAQLQLLPPPYTGTLIGGVYAQILSLPLRDLEKFWSSFASKFAVNYPLNYLASTEEAAEYTAAYPKEVPVERQTVTLADGSQQTVTLTQYCNEWELEQRRQLLAKREYTFRASLALRDEKYMFEQAISRPYFHVAPLSPPEIANWNAFLDFMEGKLMRTFNAAHPPVAGQTQPTPTMDRMDQLLLNDTLKLYERCVIPCAAYYEFWDRYAHFLDQLNEPLRAIEVRHRAITFMKRNVVGGAAPTPLQECMVALGELEEREGQVDKAREWFQQAVQIEPAQAATLAPTTAASEIDAATPLLEAILAQIRFERRQWLTAHPAAHLFEQASQVVQLFQSAIERLKPTTSLQHTKSYIHLVQEYVHFSLTQVLFISDEERLTKVRALFDAAAEFLFPKPVTTTVETLAGPPAADGTPGAPASSVTHTTVPRLIASKQYLLFWLAYVEFETTVARSPLSTLIAIYDRALVTKADLPPVVAAANPTLPGASGLSDVSRKQLWASYIATVEERATSVAEIDRVRQAAKQALSYLTHAAAPQILSVLGKRKHAATPQPPAIAPAKRPMAPAPPAQRYGGYGAGGYGQAAYGQGYGAQQAYPQQQQPAYAAAAAPAPAPPQGDYAAYYAQYGQYPPQQ